MSTYVPPKSLQETIDTSPDELLKLSILTKDDHNSIMDLINKIAVDYDKLAGQFCIPSYKVREIKHNNRDEAWTCLNAVLGEWLKWNFDKKAEELNVKPNKRWLVQAVKTIDAEIGEDIEQNFKIIAELGTAGVVNNPPKETSKKETLKS
uniref:Death domain-containing protein n=1 Tax=Amphimedon queenslandica TaxID=400682 RepID=A0A1X7VJ41_AMPQE